MQAVWKKGPMSHILSGCSVALTQDRKLWRHDKVLIKESTRKRNSRQETGCFQFIQMRTQKIQSANHQCRQRRRLGTEGGPRWEAFLPRLSRVKTTLQPDSLVQTNKVIAAIEVTVPWEENCDEPHRRKSL